MRQGVAGTGSVGNKAGMRMIGRIGTFPTAVATILAASLTSVVARADTVQVPVTVTMSVFTGCSVTGSSYDYGLFRTDQKAQVLINLLGGFAVIGNQNQVIGGNFRNSDQTMATVQCPTDVLWDLAFVGSSTKFPGSNYIDIVNPSAFDRPITVVPLVVTINGVFLGDLPFGDNRGSKFANIPLSGTNSVLGRGTGEPQVLRGSFVFGASTSDPALELDDLLTRGRYASVGAVVVVNFQPVP